MTLLNYIKESGLKSKDSSLNRVIELHNRGLSMGEVFYDSNVWADRSLNQWTLDQVFNHIKTFNKFAEKKNKYIEDLSVRNVEESVIKKLESSEDLKTLEHHYRPYKKKKKTKVTLAREAGLQTFAQELFDKATKGEIFEEGLESKAKTYIQPALGYITFEHVLKGAQDILVDQVLRDRIDLRLDVFNDAVKNAKVVIKPGEKYQEKSRFTAFVKAPSQGVEFYKNPKNFDKFPIVKKAWEDGHLRVTLDFDLSSLKDNFEKAFAPDGLKGDLSSFLKECAKKALEIHVLPSVTTEVFDDFFETSKKVYLDRLKKDYFSLLSTPAFGDKPILSIYEKTPNEVFLVLVSDTGEYVSSTTVDVTADNIVEELRKVLSDIVSSIELGAVALPLSLKSRQLEKFFTEALKKNETIPVVHVSSRGIPQFVGRPEAKYGIQTESEEGKVDNFIVSAFRLAKRLQSPIFEYAEHEPSRLLEVPSFITAEEVDEELKNTLSYVLCSLGFAPKNIGPGLISNLNWFKEDSGEEQGQIFSFVDKLRSEEIDEKKSLYTLFPKTHSRFSKFFRLDNALNVLDQSRISLDDFSKIKDFAKEKEISLLKGPVSDVDKKWDEKWTDLFGADSTSYISRELEQPFKDFRKPYKVFSFSKNSDAIDNLVQDNLYWGVVSKFSSFGAFIDIGVGTEGLVHLSELSDEFVSDPRRVLRLDQWILVKLIKLDTESKQLSLSRTKAQVSSGKNTGKKKFSNSKPHAKKGNQKFKGSKSGKPDKKGFKKPNSKSPFNNPFAAALGDLNQDS